MRTDLATARILSRIGRAGIAIFFFLVIALHFLQPGLNPWTEAVSYYVHGPAGWMLTAALLSLAIASIAVWILVHQTLDGSGRAGRICFGIWCVGVLLGGLFPADPPGSWNRPPSVPGAIHGLAAVCALSIFPAAALLLAKQLRAKHGLTVAARFCLVSYLLFLASLIPVFVRPGPPILLGLTERILLAADAWWILLALRFVGPSTRDRGAAGPESKSSADPV